MQSPWQIQQLCNSEFEEEMKTLSLMKLYELGKFLWYGCEDIEH